MVGMDEQAHRVVKETEEGDVAVIAGTRGKETEPVAAEFDGIAEEEAAAGTRGPGAGTGLGGQIHALQCKPFGGKIVHSVCGNETRTNRSMDPIMGTPLAAARQATAAVAEAITAEDFDQIIRLHQRRVYRVIFLLLGEADAADQLTQECFLRAYLRRGSFRGECAVQTWLLRIAANLAKDYGRNRRASFWRRLVRLDATERDGGPATGAARLRSPLPTPEEQLLAREELGAVWEAADALSEQQRAVFLLRFGEEMALEEVGEVLGIKTGTVKAQLARATGKLRQILRKGREK